MCATVRMAEDVWNVAELGRLQAHGAVLVQSQKGHVLVARVGTGAFTLKRIGAGLCGDRSVSRTLG